MSPRANDFSNPEAATIGHAEKLTTGTLPENGMFIGSATVPFRGDNKTSIGQVIRAARKEKGISQEELARRARVDRTTIARIECGIFKSVSMERLEGIAQAIGADLKALLLKGRSSDESMVYRGHFDQTLFSLEYPEDGFRIVSLTPKRREFFFGRIEIKPQKTIVAPKLPHAEQIYIHLFDGKMLLTRFPNELLLKPGDCFVFSGLSDYEFYNPDQLRSVSALFVTYPSFLPT